MFISKSTTNLESINRSNWLLMTMSTDIPVQPYVVTGESVSEGPITYTPQVLDQVTTYVVTDSTGEIVATEGVTVANESSAAEDPDNLQFELTTVDDSGMPITFQVWEGVDVTIFVMSFKVSYIGLILVTCHLKT